MMSKKLVHTTVNVKNCLSGVGSNQNMKLNKVVSCKVCSYLYCICTSVTCLANVLITFYQNSVQPITFQDTRNVTLLWYSNAVFACSSGAVQHFKMQFTQGILKGELGLFLTPVLTLRGGGHIGRHAWRRVIVSSAHINVTQLMPNEIAWLA